MTKIIKRKDGRYEARPIIDRRKHYILDDTQRAVAEKMADLKRQHKRRRLGLPDEERVPEAITYDQLCERVLDSYPHAETSKTSLFYNLKRSRDHFGPRLLRELDTETLSTWLAVQPGSQATKRHTLKALRYALRRAVRWGFLPSNPAEAVEMPQERLAPAQPLKSWEEVEKLADHLKSHTHRALVRFAAATGLRPQEWRALQWRDFDPAHKTIRIARTVRGRHIAEGEAKTPKSLRTVQLTSPAIAALNSLPRNINERALIFPGERGGVLDYARWRRGPWATAIKEAGLDPCGPYALRDTYATLGLSAGAPVEWLAEQMGNSPAVLLKHYATWLPEAHARNIDLLNKLAAGETGQKADSQQVAK